MKKALTLVLAGLSALVIPGCSLLNYAASGEKIPSEYVGRKTMEIHQFERDTRELGYWLHDVNENLRY